MTSEEDWKKRLKRLQDRLIGRNGDSRSGGTQRPQPKRNDNPLDGFNDNPKRDRRR